MKKIQIAILVIMFSTPLISQKICLEGKVKMLALGDSYTIGESVEIDGRWPHQFIAQVRALGFEGDDPEYIATTGWTTQRLIQGMNSMINKEKDFNLVSILIGVNNQYQGIDIVSYEPDLRAIIDRALEIVNQDTCSLLILSIPDYAYTPFGGGSELISAEIDKYNNIKKRIAAEYQIAYVDITPISRTGLSNPTLVASDGLHPSAVQYGEWVKAIEPRLQFKMPLHTNIPGEVGGDPISLYPNPAGSLVKIDSLREVKRISIYNTAGSLVSDERISSMPAEIDLSHLASGMYTVWIYHTDEEAVSRRTLIVQPGGA